LLDRELNILQWKLNIIQPSIHILALHTRHLFLKGFCLNFVGLLATFYGKNIYLGS